MSCIAVLCNEMSWKCSSRDCNTSKTFLNCLSCFYFMLKKKKLFLFLGCWTSENIQWYSQPLIYWPSGQVGKKCCIGHCSHLSHIPPDSVVMTGSYNNFFRMFDRGQRRDVTLEASRENSKPMQVLKPRKVCAGGKRKKDEISVDSLDFNKKILHTAWHPQDNIIAVATTNNLYIFQDKVN